MAAGGDGSRSWLWRCTRIGLHLALRLFEDELNEVAVLPLGDAITDGACIALNLAELLRGERSQAWISVCRTGVIPGVSQGC